MLSSLLLFSVVIKVVTSTDSFDKILMTSCEDFWRDLTCGSSSLDFSSNRGPAYYGQPAFVKSHEPWPWPVHGVVCVACWIADARGASGCGGIKRGSDGRGAVRDSCSSAVTDTRSLEVCTLLFASSFSLPCSLLCTALLILYEFVF